MSTATLEITPTADPVTPEQALERSRIVLGWLLEGALPSSAVDKAQQEWGVGLRMAQVYVQRAKQLLAEEAEEEELRYYRRLSQQQRDRLIFVLFRALKHAEQMQPDILRSLASIITAGTKLLESRDRLVLGEAKEAQVAQVAQLDRKRQEAAEVSRLLAEADEKIRRGKEPMRGGPAPKKPTPPPPASAPRLVRPLEPGEPVFDKQRPVNQREMTPRQLEEWLLCIHEHGDPRKFPWFKDGALDAALDPDPNDGAAVVRQKQAFDNAFKLDLIGQLSRSPNPAAEIAIVPSPTKGKVKEPAGNPQAKSR